MEVSSSKRFYNEDYADIPGVTGDPKVSPRVGDEYQAELPHFMPKSGYATMNNGANIQSASDNRFVVGLAIPLKWLTEKAPVIQRETEDADGRSPKVSNRSRRSGKARVIADDDGGKANADHQSAEVSNRSNSLVSKGFKEAQVVLEGEDVRSNFEIMDTSLKLNGSQDSALQKENFTKMECHLVPDSPFATWSEIEEAGFLLGLYIFGKKFTLVKKLVESKPMRDIFAFYYGKFYDSDEYLKWKECQKIRSVRCGFAHKLFTGWRHQELLSRLPVQISEKSQTALQEVSRKYSESKMQVREYIFSLKAAVGLTALVEAAGIGKGKQDLIHAASPSKSNQSVPRRWEIPVGKTWAGLALEDIMKFLSGDIPKLNKTRSTELFWEAVWPRLLARGWHHEKPGEQYVAVERQPCVFLIPGMKKFSRRKLVKGRQYFVSVADVLRKVAAEPSLIELEDDDENKGRGGKQRKTSTESKKSKLEDIPEQQSRSNLNPPTPVDNEETMKFTVVDSSVFNRKSFKVRALSSFPEEGTNCSTSRRHCEDNDQDSDDHAVAESMGKPASSSGGGNQGSGLSGSLEDTYSVAEKSEGKFKGLLLVDLNLPPPEAEIYEPQGAEGQLTTPKRADIPEEQSAPNSRRLGSRNRPPTTRALEAIALGFLDARPKRKCKDAGAEEKSRPSKRACSKVKSSENSRRSVEDIDLNERPKLPTSGRNDDDDDASSCWN